MLGSAPLVFNGKFLTNDLTGVHRVAFELIHACGRLRHEGNGADAPMEIAVPSNAILPRWHAAQTLDRFRIMHGVSHGHTWEQLELPWRARGKVLINLCNLAPALKKKSITMIHDAHVFNVPLSYSFRFRSVYRTAIPLIGRFHSHIVTVSRYSQAEIVKHKIAAPEKISVVHNGVDHMLRFKADYDILDKLDLRLRTYVVGLSSDQLHKNIGLLLRAFCDPRLRDVRCVLIGQDRRQEFMQAGFSVPENIVFSGPLSDDELRGLLEAATATVCPSTTEGFGLLPLEGMVLGCPAIVSRRGSLPEICGTAAVYVEPHDAEGWVAAIAHFCRHGDDREAYAQRGRVQAGKFTWSLAARHLLDLCDRMTAAQRPPRGVLRGV